MSTWASAVGSYIMTRGAGKIDIYPDIMPSMDVKQEVAAVEYVDPTNPGDLPATHEVNEMALLRKIDWHLVPVSLTAQWWEDALTW